MVSVAVFAVVVFVAAVRTIPTITIASHLVAMPRLARVLITEMLDKLSLGAAVPEVVMTIESMVAS